MSPSSGSQVFHEYGIPIRNLWHMLIYAWDEVSLQSPVTRGEVESAPTLDALFALVLIRSMRRRMRTGLGHAYIEETKSQRGIRGRVNFNESLRQHSFEKGEVVSDFQHFSANEPRNQVVRSTLARLVQSGQFGPKPADAEALRNLVRKAVRELDGIDLIDLRHGLIRRILLAENDHDYRLMLSVCELLLQRQMPLEEEGTSLHPGLDRDSLILHRIYERFVANFYRIRLKGWIVTAQKRLDWHAGAASEHLPSMVPDLLLQSRESGRLILLDTKFSAGSLVENRWGKPVYDSSHLYQMYAYLRSQEHLSEAHRAAVGILLYPAAQHSFSEHIQLQDHVLLLACVDLGAAWQQVEEQLVELVENA
jgi:5-methylcytosine-specific restriction enzyme subunit McrC